MTIITEERIRHRIERHEKMLERLNDIGDDLSNAGYWDKGYVEGKLYVLYE